MLELSPNWTALKAEGMRRMRRVWVGVCVEREGRRRERWEHGF
ncbi:MAG: hypothetical protein ACKESB_01570 [Candidatus Hodgkinia cicadicola]